MEKYKEWDEEYCTDLYLYTWRFTEESTLELQKANALDKKMSKCPRNVVARRKQTHSQDKV